MFMQGQSAVTDKLEEIHVHVHVHYKTRLMMSVFTD